MPKSTKVGAGMLTPDSYETALALAYLHKAEEHAVTAATPGMSAHDVMWFRTAMYCNLCSANAVVGINEPRALEVHCARRSEAWLDY